MRKRVAAWALNVRFQERALSDLQTIHDWIAQDDPRAADRVLLRIDQSISLLEKFPRIGRAGSVEETREISVPNTPYIVVYTEPDAYEIWILRVLHSRQKYPPDDG